MDFNIRTGLTNKSEKVVMPEDTAARYGSGLIEVFATPAMVGFMECSAQQCVQKFLPEGYITLGIEINVKHFKATPIGMNVYCESILTHIDGKKLVFEIKAWDEKGEIGQANHTRFIVEGERFMAKLSEQNAQ